MEKLDSTDITILSMLQSNARYTLKDMAQAVDLSTPAVSSRLEKLESSNIIKGYTALTNYSALGLGISAFLFVDVIPTVKKDFIAYLNEQTNVLSLDWITGEYSAMVKAIFTDINALHEFSQAMSERFGSVTAHVTLRTEFERTTIDLSKIAEASKSGI